MGLQMTSAYGSSSNRYRGAARDLQMSETEFISLLPDWPQGFVPLMPVIGGTGPSTMPEGVEYTFLGGGGQGITRAGFSDPWDAFSVVVDCTGDEPRTGEMTALQQTAKLGDIRRFRTLVQEIDWTDHAAFDISSVVRWALELGAHQVARELADKGHSLYSLDDQLARLQQLTAPPRRSSDTVHPETSVRRNHEWLTSESAAYRGLWVALKDGVLIASACSTGELKKRLGDLQGYLITKVV